MMSVLSPPVTTASAFTTHTGAQVIAGHVTPSNFTNYITRSFKEPRLLVVTDPCIDAQAIRDAAYVNITVIALCDTDAPLQFVEQSRRTIRLGTPSVSSGGSSSARSSASAAPSRARRMDSAS